MWNWIINLPPSGASFLGTLTGSGLGLVALLIGALFNAQLNRWRDDRLRNDDARAVASALKAELAGVKETLVGNAERIDKDEPHDFLIPDIAHSVRVMPGLLPKLGLLDIATTQEVMGAYVSLDQYCEYLIMMGGTIATKNRSDRRLVGMPKESAKNVAAMNRGLVRQVDGAMAKLDAFLGAK